MKNTKERNMKQYWREILKEWWCNKFIKMARTTYQPNTKRKRNRIERIKEWKDARDHERLEKNFIKAAKKIQKHKTNKTYWTDSHEHIRKPNNDFVNASLLFDKAIRLALKGYYVKIAANADSRLLIFEDFWRNKDELNDFLRKCKYESPTDIKWELTDEQAKNRKSDMIEFKNIIVKRTIWTGTDIAVAAFCIYECNERKQTCFLIPLFKKNVGKV